MAKAEAERIAELEARIDGLVDALVEMAGRQAYPVVIGPIAPCARPHADHGYWYSPSYPHITWTTNGTATSSDGSRLVS